jgi:uncharacterized protein YggE
MMRTLFVSLVMVALMLPLSHAQISDFPKSHLITVNGTAEVKVTPDKAVITINIETMDKDVAISKNQNDEIVKKVIDSCTRLGITASDISTDFINVDSRFQRDYEQKKFLGYNMRRRVAITLKDISKFDNLITELLASGIDGIQDVVFQTTDLRKYKDQARAESIRAAQEKAQAMAKELGQTIGKAISIEERGSNSQSWYNSWYSGYGRNYPNPFNASSEAPAPANLSDSDTPLALGKISITASVLVSFELQ